MSGFEAGEVVVCINVGRDPRATMKFTGGFLRLGKCYRVTWVGVTSAGVVGLMLQGGPTNGAWAADRFRKLPRADADFTAQIRACRPHSAKPPVLA
jgi:hypothetical protein